MSPYQFVSLQQRGSSVATTNDQAKEEPSGNGRQFKSLSFVVLISLSRRLRSAISINAARPRSAERFSRRKRAVWRLQRAFWRGTLATFPWLHVQVAIKIPLHWARGEMFYCWHRCNCHWESLAGSTQRNVPVMLPPPLLSGSTGDFVRLGGLQQRSQAGKETLERLGNLSVSLDFYLFPLPCRIFCSRISVNRNFPLLSNNCVISAAEAAASLMSLGWRQSDSWSSSHSLLRRCPFVTRTSAKGKLGL